MYRDDTTLKNNKINLRLYLKEIKNNRLLINSHLVSLIHGLTYSGAFASLITIYIIKVFKNSISFGIFTSIFAFITAIAGFLFANFISKKKYKQINVISNLITIIALIIMMLNCNFITVILFNFGQSFAKTFVELINHNNIITTSNTNSIKNEYKEEYFITREIFMYFGRIISYACFTMLAFTKSFLNTQLVLIVFVFFILMLMFKSKQLQIKIEKLG